MNLPNIFSSNSNNTRREKYRAHAESTNSTDSASRYTDAILSLDGRRSRVEDRNHSHRVHSKDGDSHAIMSGLGKMLQQIVSKQESLSHLNARWHITHFPHSTPMVSSRKDIKSLKNWYEQSLKHIGDLQMHSEDHEKLKELQQLLSIVMYEMIRHETVKCVDRGRLLNTVWVHNLNLLDHAIQLWSDKKAEMTELQLMLSQELEALKINYRMSLKELENNSEESKKRFQEYESKIYTQEAELSRVRRYNLTVMELIDYLGKEKIFEVEQREAMQKDMLALSDDNCILRNQISSLNAKILVLRRTMRRIDEMYSADEIVAVDEILSHCGLDKHTQTLSSRDDFVKDQNNNGTPQNTGNVQMFNSLCQSLKLQKTTEHNPSIHTQDWLWKTLWRVYQEHAYSNNKNMEQRGKRRRFAEFLSGYFLRFSGSLHLSEKRILDLLHTAIHFVKVDPCAMTFVAFCESARPTDSHVVYYKILNILKERQNQSTTHLVFDPIRSAIDLQVALQVLVQVFDFVKRDSLEEIRARVVSAYNRDFTTRDFGEQYSNCFNLHGFLWIMVSSWESCVTPIWNIVSQVFLAFNVDRTVTLPFDEFLMIIDPLRSIVNVSEQRKISIYHDVMTADISKRSERFKFQIQQQWALCQSEYNMLALKQELERIDITQIKRDAMIARVFRKRASARVIQRAVRDWLSRRRQEGGDNNT